MNVGVQQSQAWCSFIGALG